MSQIQKDILLSCGRRFARIIADAQVGDTITASLAYCHATADEIDTWLARRWIVDTDRGVVFNGVKPLAAEGQVS